MKISFYDTFIVQNFKDSHFTPNNYKGILLKMRVKITLFLAISILFLRKSIKNLNFDHKGIILKNRGQNQPLRYFSLEKYQKPQF